MIKFLGRKLTEFKFKYYELNIIQDIQNERFSEIISNYVAQGWEVAGSYQGATSDDDWDCKLRKGQSELKCEWSKRSKGSIIGPQRIIVALGKEFALPALKSPKWI